MDDLIAEFLTETNESLGALDVDLVNLEQNPNDKDLLSNIFRLMHTIKGTCGFLGLPRLEKVAHHAENIMGRFRDGDLEVIPDYVTLIFESLDRIKDIIAELEETGQEPEGDDSELIEKLDEVYEGRDVHQTGGGANGATPPPQDSAPAEEQSAPANDQAEEDEGESQDSDELQALFDSIEALPPDQIQDLKMPHEMSEEERAAKRAEALAAELAAKEQATAAPQETPKEAPAAKKEEPKKEEPAKAAAQNNAPPAGDKPAVAQSLRVNVDVLENLMTMVSELVLTRNQLLQILRTQKESEFSAPLQRLNHVVSDLQEGVMKTRMQPIGNAWSKLPRIIRDLSIELGKKINLEMLGAETELDRQVLDMIKDPLTHMVRNSADHGIEMPDERAAAGKPETGTVILNAYHEGGHIIIEIKDDGKGLNTDLIKEKVLANGLASQEELDNMSTQQIQQFIFNAGLSTAEKVTAVSGRGVGMDVVRTNIEKIGGSIELRSIEGKGSTFAIKIPLTLAIVSALIVEAGGERFAIPQLAVKELVLINKKSEIQIEDIKGVPFFRLREQLLPLVSLTDLLNIESQKIDLPRAEPPSVIEVPVTEESAVEDVPTEDSMEEDGAPEDEQLHTYTLEEAEEESDYIVVTQIGAYLFGIIVDRVFDTEEIVVKPVSKILKDIEMFSGNTILGDGSVIMILDPAGIAKATGKAEGAETSDSVEEKSAYTGDDRTSLLLFKAGDGAPKAVPLSLVARLEEIDLASVEYASGQHMVQYRGKLMPLVTMEGSPPLGSEGEQPVLVFTEHEKSMGLAVDEIVDITEAIIDVQVAGKGNGMIGSAIIEEKATDVVDIGTILKSNDQNWFKNHDDTPYGQDAMNGKKILLIDDSPFFRNMLSPLLKMAGYNVTVLDNAMHALKMREKGESFDLIISDIEMPEMDGFEFAQQVRSEESEWKNLPLVALTSHDTPEDMERGNVVGFNKYVAKFDRDQLLNTLSQTLSEGGAA